MLKKRRAIFTLLLLIYGLFFQLSRTVSAQAFTFDYLTYSDWGLTGREDSSKGKMTSFLFFGVNEFDRLGKASAHHVSYKELHLYGAYRIYNRKQVQLTVAILSGLLLSETIASRMSGTPWLWGKFRFSQKFPLALRMGFKWGKLGDAFWLEDNQFDLGMLSSKNFGFGMLDASLSYRIRGKSNHGLNDFTGSFNEAGNEIHYKLKAVKNIGSKTFLSLLVFGYNSGDKKSDGFVMPDSYSRKMTLGGEFGRQTKKGRIYALGILYDAAGRYDKKGVTFVFNVMD